MAQRSGGDARTALNILELAAQTAQAEGSPVTEAHVEDAARKPPLVYDKAGDAHYDYTSAFIKSMRGSDADAAVYYLAAMLEGGEDARFIARRMIVLASEDIGNADPRALLVAVAAAQAVEHVGLPEARLNLAQAAIYLARAPKSNASYMALNRATADVQEHGAARPPKALRDGSWYGRRLGHGEGYVYPHDDPQGFETSYLPEELEGRRYYEPSGGSRRGERGRERLVGLLAVDREDHAFERLRREDARLLDHDRGAPTERKAADPGPERGQRERASTELVGELETGPSRAARRGRRPSGGPVPSRRRGSPSAPEAGRPSSPRRCRAGSRRSPSPPARSRRRRPA